MSKPGFLVPQRKAVLVTLGAIIVIVLVVVLASQPKKGSIEWHKKKYFALLDRAAARTWRDKLRRGYERLSHSKPATTLTDDRAILFDELRHHENALIALGFLERREIPHEGRTVVVGEETIISSPRIHKISHEGFTPNGMRWANRDLSPYARSIPAGLKTIVIGVPEDMPKLEEIIRNQGSP